MTRTYKADFAAVAEALGLDPDVDAAVAVQAVTRLAATAQIGADVENQRNHYRDAAKEAWVSLETIRNELRRRRETVRVKGVNAAFADMSEVSDLADAAAARANV